MKIITKSFSIIAIFCFAFACSKKDSSSIKPDVIKCTSSTILDELLSGKQMYILATVLRGKVLLNLKDKKGKARAFSSRLVNPELYEWDIQISSVNDTEVKLQAGAEIIAIQGIYVAGEYFPDSFFFKDDNCKIIGETFDGQTINNNLIIYENVTNNKDLSAILENYHW